MKKTQNSFFKNTQEYKKLKQNCCLSSETTDGATGGHGDADKEEDKAKEQDESVTMVEQLLQFHRGDWALIEYLKSAKKVDHPPLGIASLRAANPLLELRLFEPPSPEGALKKISEQTIPSELPEKK